MGRYTITQDYTIKEVMELFEQNPDRVAFMVNKENKVIGCISQGDIIKALTAGKNIYSDVRTIVNESFIYLNEKDIQKAYNIVKSKKITLIPVLDSDNRIIDVITLDDIFQYLESKL